MNKKTYLMRPFVGGEEIEAVKKVFESKYRTESPVKQRFESKFAEYVVAKYGIA